MISGSSVVQTLSFLEQELVDEILQYSILQKFPAGTILIKEGQYIKHLPVVIDGIIKVFSRYDDKELLLYYIQSKQSCIISFEASIHNDPSKIFAETEQSSKILLIPSGRVSDWTNRFPKFRQLFFDLYHNRYLDLLNTINQLVFQSLDHRLYQYLIEKKRILKKDELDLRHHLIARDLGTAREVVTRVLKKLELEGKISVDKKGIKIL